MYKIVILILLLTSLFACKTSKQEQTTIANNQEQQFENTKERDAKLINNGIDFTAMGSEPDWSLDIDFDKNYAILFIFGENKKTFDIIDNKDNSIENIVFDSKENNLQFEVLEQVCYNSMSGEGFPYSIQVKVNGKKYVGCAKYLGETSNIKSINTKIYNKWVLSELNGVDFNKEYTPYFSISRKDNKVGGFSSCNRFSGSYKLYENNLKFGQFAMTKKYCQNSIEMKFMSALNKTNSYEILDNKLILYGASKKKIMTLVVGE